MRQTVLSSSPRFHFSNIQDDGFLVKLDCRRKKDNLLTILHSLLEPEITVTEEFVMERKGKENVWGLERNKAAPLFHPIFTCFVFSCACYLSDSLDQAILNIQRYP